MTKTTTLILGTALWGWSIDESQAFALLDDFYERGYRWVDTSTNYPIDKNPAHFGLSARLLGRWMAARSAHDLRVVLKVGGLSNMGTPENDLSAAFLTKTWTLYQDMFGDRLDSLWVHWDNRDHTDSIKETLETLQSLSPKSPVGLSGIAHPEIYAAAAPAAMRFRIQVKHNLFQSDLDRYDVLRSRSAFYTYRLNGGGLSLSKELPASGLTRLREMDAQTLNRLSPTLKDFVEQSLTQQSFRVSTLNEIGMLYAYGAPGVEGLLIGPSKVPQLDESIKFFERLQKENWSSAFAALNNLHSLPRP